MQKAQAGRLSLKSEGRKEISWVQPGDGESVGSGQANKEPTLSS